MLVTITANETSPLMYFAALLVKGGFNFDFEGFDETSGEFEVHMFEDDEISFDELEEICATTYTECEGYVEEIYMKGDDVEEIDIDDLTDDEKKENAELNEVTPEK